MNKTIIIMLFSIFLVSCGGSGSSTKSVGNAHNESFELLRWSNSKLPLVIKVPAQAYSNSNFRDALESAADTWNDSLRSTVGQDVFRIESFNNSILTQEDLENSLLGVKCRDKIEDYCNECSGSECTSYCSQCSSSDCSLNECNSQFAPLTIVDYLQDNNMVVSNPSEWFDKVSDLTIAVTGYTYDVNTNIIIDADIVFNQENYNFSYGDPVDDEEIDYESSLLHELGHFLGLKHIEKEEDPKSIMNPSLSKGQIKRVLSEKDKKLVQELYN